MNSTNLRIVSNNIDLDSENLRSTMQELHESAQLHLFELQITMVAVSDLYGPHYIRLLNNFKPDVIIETRYYPDYVYAYNSAEAVFNDYKNRGIEYFSNPIKYDGEFEEKSMHIRKFVDIINQVVDDKCDSKIFVLTRTEYHLNQISSLIKNHVLGAFPNVKFEKICDSEEF